jgi:type I restriction enzyme S subunit
MLNDGRGANIQNVNQQMLGALEIPFPPLPLQRRFADFIRQTDKSKFEMQQGLKQLELQYSALMQEYFG